MIIQGTHSVMAPRQNVWNLLMDPEILLKITPGISELKPLGDDKFTAISKIKIGPVKASFEGQLLLMNKIENTSATLAINQKSKIGNVSAEIELQLNSAEGITEIDYKGEAKLTGKLAMMGQRIIGGVVNSLTKQFFKALNSEINHNH